MRVAWLYKRGRGLKGSRACAAKAMLLMHEDCAQQRAPVFQNHQGLKA